MTSYCNDEVADQALALMLATLRRVALHDRLIREGRWDFRLGGPVHRIRRMTIIGYDPYRSDWPDWLESASLDELLSRSDVVSLHVGLTEQTAKMIDASTLARMKPGAVLINTARGGLVDGAALAQALEDGPVSGAGLDVSDPEPLPADHAIMQCPNVVLSPHIGFYSEESLAQLKCLAAEVVRDVLVNGMHNRALNADALR